MILAHKSLAYKSLNINRNPKSGAQVRTFVTDPEPRRPRLSTHQRTEIDENLLLGAAKNMTCLSKALFNFNPLAVQVVTTLPLYPELTDLSLDGFTPSKHIWKNEKTSLRKLHWKKSATQYTYYADKLPDMFVELRLLLKVVEATCPDMEVFNIELANTNSIPPERDTVVPPELMAEYNALLEQTEARLSKLRRFGFIMNRVHFHAGNEEIRTFILDVVGRYGHCLESITIPGGAHAWTREGLDFILKVCSLVPNLRELNVLGNDLGLGSGSKLGSMEALRALTTSPATAKIEKFSIMNMGGHFSKETGEVFKAWKNLKFLQVGDEDISGGPFGDDGRPQFDEYRPVSTIFDMATF
ncbi:MAG: hypothetical protein CL912_20945 [Deltaproteobacteria bacterium]|nr:hypothetical protein [Deltaproteobacteria bacterium]